VPHRRCRECGIPRRIGRVHHWQTNGTIVNAQNPTLRHVFMEADFLPELRRRISEGLGYPVNGLFYDAERIAIRGTVEAFLGSLTYRVPSRVPFMRSLVVRYFNNLAWQTGTASSCTVKYKPGKYGVARMRNPFDLDLMAAVVAGAFEALDKKPFSSSWSKQDADYLIRVEAMHGNPDRSERFEIQSLPAKPGENQLPLCPSCGLPAGLGHLEWRDAEGIIIDRRSGTRMINLDGYTSILVNRELLRELGEEALPIIIGAERDATIKMLMQEGVRNDAPGENGENRLREMLDILPLYGWGLASSIEYSPGNLMHIWVDNPYDEYLLAGRISGFYQVIEGREAQVNWSLPEPSTICYTLSPNEG
jgi:hypothetical protein